MWFEVNQERARPAEPPSYLIKSCLEQRPMAVLSLPTVDDLLVTDAESGKHFPYNKT